jgi:hypothetical protein
MSQTFGIEARHAAPGPAGDVPPARYLVLIDSAASGTRQARLFLDSREQVAEFDAAGPEVQALARGLLARQDAWEPAWDAALAGHTAAERRAAQVFTLDV